MAAGRRRIRSVSSPRPTRRSKTTRFTGETIVARHRADFEIDAGRSDSIHRRDAEPNDRRLGRFDSVPRARRREPRPHGFEHAAASRAAAWSPSRRSSAPAWSATSPCNSGMIVRAGHKGTVTYVDADRIEIGPEVHPTAEVRRPQRAHLPEPEADRQGRRQGRKGPGHRRRCRHVPGRTGPGPQRARRVHVVGRIQLRRRDHHQRRAGEERHVHVAPHRRVRRRNSRDEAGPRGVHSRYSERQRKDAPQPGRKRHRANRHVRRAGRHPRRQGFAEEQDRADAGRKAAARDLRPRRRRREERFARSAVGRRRHRHRHAAVLPPHEPHGRSSARSSRRTLKAAEKEGNEQIAAGVRRAGRRDGDDHRPQGDRRRRQAAGPRSGSGVRRRAGRERSRSTRIDLRSPQKQEGCREGLQAALAERRRSDRRPRSQAELDEARRRASQRRAADGEGLHRHEARDLGRRQDGRPPR